MEYTNEEIKELLGETCFETYQKLNSFIFSSYNFIKSAWGKRSKHGSLCLRYSSGRTKLCTFYFRPNQFSVWIVYGEKEQLAFEQREADFTEYTKEKYHNTLAFRDGKWLMFDISDSGLLPDIQQLILIKKKPSLKK